ncbi:hypothetical protein BU26DRAFT_539765 [Trematosphaeria pertusa]|uniref:ARM repeat-containing protein n=1 Tax=Trematosphaeria pertusa TaxID=390896 RepID=A0A6A6ILF9_9PLEO|nr:uncharacterized protein BU26DRAFT_539765 [Trematosphaeria pertusa]KAF2251455.1 hypothetical protein BU26DRAFT_539765 [Trematosphaeria pertusa]
MTSPLDSAMLRSSSPREVAEYLRQALNNSSNAEITRQLISLVEIGSHPPSILQIWLSISPSHSTLQQTLKQKASIEVRGLAIKHLQKMLTSSQWQETWDGLGGVPGLLDIFHDLSVREVRGACLAIGFSARGGDVDRKRAVFTELFKSLLPRLFPDASLKTSDHRPLLKHYQRLVLGCTEDVVSSVLDGIADVKWTRLRRNAIMQYHADTLRKLALRYVFEGYPSGEKWLSPLLSGFPPETTSEPGVSTSMAFSLQVLRRLAREEPDKLSDEYFLNSLVEPLLTRAVRKRVDWVKIQEIVDLTLPYLERHSGMARKLHRHHHGLLHLVALCWSRRSEMFESQFGFLLSYSHEGMENVGIGRFKPLMEGVPKSRRYTLLRFCMQVVSGRDLDVEADFQGMNRTLTCSLLGKLPAQDALGLFTRMRKTNGDVNLVWKRYDHVTVLDDGPTPDSASGDPDMFQTVLLQRSGHQKAAEDIAERLGQARRKSAMSSPSPEQRAFFARTALHYAIASGSLKLCKEAFEWARRFKRDPLTAKELHHFYPQELTTLLSGIPEVIEPGIASSELRQRVKAANQIMEELFDTLCSALREPSFSVGNWSGCIRLFFSVVQERIRRSSQLKSFLNLSDAQLYDILWDDTGTMLVAVEEKALAPGHERLLGQSVGGILGYYQSLPTTLKAEEPSTYHFFDELAKARDDLWCKYRRTIHPAITTLHEPFPRGLPVQHLIEPYILDNPALESQAPYIASRVKAAVFPHPALALSPIPKDEETQAAIGRFIDDYASALRMLVPTTLEDDERKDRIERAWAHATGPLSETRMSAEEAVRYWQKTELTQGRYIHFGPLKPPAEDEPEEWRLLPNADNPAEVEEWNPLPPPKPAIKPRELETLTYIDVSKHIGTKSAYGKITVRSTLELYPAVIPAPEIQIDCIWSWQQNERAKGHPAMREGQIISALLFLDTFNSSKMRILSKPFPSEEDARYPSVYLDEQFLSKALRAHIKHVPTPVLAQVADNTMKTLEVADPKATTFAELERLAFMLIELLAQSDRPGLASELAIRAVIQRPDSSSWHRRLLSRGFFQQLPESDAHACISAFANAIIERMEEQAKAKDAPRPVAANAEAASPPAESTSEANGLPFIKITTVKLLAQLLNSADYVPEEVALSTLSKLIEKASHVDIRYAVVESLLNMLISAPPELTERILAALKTVVPIAGNLRERQPISEADWTRATETLELPELDPAHSAETHAPILTSLIAFLRRQPEEAPDFPHRAAYMERVILPTVTGLKKQVGRWNSLFLRKFGIDVAAQSELKVPLMPREKDILQDLLAAGSSHLPLSLLEEYVAYVTFTVAPPPPIRTLNKKLQDDSKLSSQSDVRAWLSRYGMGPAIIADSHTMSLTTLLRHSSQLKGQITPKAVQAQFLTLYTAVLWNDDENFYCLDKLTRPLWPFSTRDKIDKEWAEYYKPIVEAMVLYVEGIRTRDWERDPGRRPKVLPDTFEYRMWLLQYAAQHSSSSEDPEAHSKAFSERVSKVVEQISGSMYHKKFARLKEALEYVQGDDRVRVACSLGDISKTRLSWLTKLDHLRVELAAEMLMGLRDEMEDMELKKRVETLRLSWQKAESEEVRRLGFRLGAYATWLA